MGVLENQRIRQSSNRALRRRTRAVQPAGTPERGGWKPFRWLRRDPRDLLTEDRPDARRGRSVVEGQAGTGAGARAWAYAQVWIAETWEGATWLSLAAVHGTVYVAQWLAVVTVALLGWTRSALRRARPHVGKGARWSANQSRRVASRTRTGLRNQAEYMQDGFPDVRQGAAVVRRGVDGAREQMARNVARVNWPGQLGWPGWRQVGRAIGTGLVLGFASAAVIAAGLVVPAKLEQSGALTVREISVEGYDKVSEQQILTAAGVEYGEQLAQVDLERVADGVRSLPWVESVNLRRRYPDRFAIQVVERDPAMLLADGQLWFVDGQGEVFKPVAPGEWMDLPVVTGLTLDDRVADPDGARRRLREVEALVGAVDEAASLNAADIAEIELLATGGYRIRTADAGVALELGPADYERGLERLDTLLNAELLELDGVTEVDLSLRNQVVAVRKVDP
ncbi:MAG: FtsQ-type POTRA domain-containing protein [Myxococcota bacterium]|nr:FtsQ-type POTRA domain-containing protein [Myxococcota bacterium]